MVDITEIYVHWYAGRSKSALAPSLGADRKTVRKYLAPGRGIRDGPSYRANKLHDVARDVERDSIGDQGGASGSADDLVREACPSRGFTSVRARGLHTRSALDRVGEGDARSALGMPVGVAVVARSQRNPKVISAEKTSLIN